MSATHPFTLIPSPPLNSLLRDPQSQCAAPCPPCFPIRHLSSSPPPSTNQTLPVQPPLAHTRSILCISTALSQVTPSCLDCGHAYLVYLPQPRPDQPILSTAARVILPVGRQDHLTVLMRPWQALSRPKLRRFLRLQDPPLDPLLPSPFAPLPPAMAQFPFMFCACLTVSSQSSVPYLPQAILEHSPPPLSCLTLAH